MSKVVIACGGTGGHLVPGIAVAQRLKSSGHDCLLLISKKRVDSRLIEKYPELSFKTTPGVGLRLNPISALIFLIEFLRGSIICFVRFLRFRPKIVIAFGGFTSLSAVFIGKLFGAVILLHEANRVPGKATRILGKYADRIYLPDGVGCPKISSRRICNSGYPVRDEFKNRSKVNSRKKLGFHLSNKLLLVIGGSQGAKSLNTWVLDNFEYFAEEGIEICCITGIANSTKGKLDYTASNGQTYYCHLIPFTDDMSVYLNAADVVISRAGAGSIAEIVQCEVPCILIPYPYAADNHQLMNARFLEKQGAAIIVEEDLIEKNLTKEVKELVYNDWLCQKFIEKHSWIKKRNDCSSLFQDIEKILTLTEKTESEAK